MDRVDRSGFLYDLQGDVQHRNVYVRGNGDGNDLLSDGTFRFDSVLFQGDGDEQRGHFRIFVCRECDDAGETRWT